MVVWEVGGRNGGVGDGRKEWRCGRWERGGMVVWEVGTRRKKSKVRNEVQGKVRKTYTT